MKPPLSRGNEGFALKHSWQRPAHTRLLSCRTGVTLLEVLVVMAIIAVMVTLLVASIQRVREVALRAESANNLRQIALGTHSFAAHHQNVFPSLGDMGKVNGGVSLFFAIFPYIEQENLYDQVNSGVLAKSGDYFIALLVSPADPSVRRTPEEAGGVVSYAANGQVFFDNVHASVFFLDGTSNTIAFAEHYTECGETRFFWNNIIPRWSSHRGSFADFRPGGNSFGTYNPAKDDVYPVTAGMPPVSSGSVPGLTFQVRPSLQDCDPRIPQTPHSGMLIALADGSVRTLAAGISPQTYWGAVTPARGEMLGDDWAP